MSKEELILQLQKSAKELGHSPKKRDIPSLAIRCHKKFGSFNSAKVAAGLNIMNVRIDKFPKNAFKLDRDLSAIISYVTFDGHLYKNLKGLFYSSKNLDDLKAFEKIMKRKFGLPSKYHLNKSGSHKQTHLIYFFNKRVCEFIFKSGCPKGDKAIQSFDVPVWIKVNKEFSREYLKIAYLCEGSMEEELGRKPRISFTQSKHIDILGSGLNFMNSIKSMLKIFQMETGDTYISSNSRIRKRDNKIMKDIRFRVLVKDSNRFISEIGWLK